PTASAWSAHPTPRPCSCCDSRARRRKRWTASSTKCWRSCEASSPTRPSKPRPTEAYGAQWRPVRILIVKLSSLGDVVHTMAAAQDIRRSIPGARIDWVVEKGFAPLVSRCEGVAEAIPCELRRWSKSPLSHETRADWRTFRKRLRSVRYDAVIDLQGLTKSALVARAARTTDSGKRFAMANRTDGASY